MSSVIIRARESKSGKEIIMGGLKGALEEAFRGDPPQKKPEQIAWEHAWDSLIGAHEMRLLTRGTLRALLLLAKNNKLVSKDQFDSLVEFLQKHENFQDDQFIQDFCQ